MPPLQAHLVLESGLFFRLILYWKRLLLASLKGGTVVFKPAVLRRVLQIASLTCLATLCLFYPLIESLDGFDSPVPASDLEIEIIVLLTFVGIAFVLAHLLASAAISMAMDVLRYLMARTGAPAQMVDLSFHPLQTASPPLPLRI